MEGGRLDRSSGPGRDPAVGELEEEGEVVPEGEGWDAVMVFIRGS